MRGNMHVIQASCFFPPRLKLSLNQRHQGQYKSHFPEPIFTMTSKSTWLSTRALEICAACWKWTLSAGRTVRSLRDQSSNLKIPIRQRPFVQGFIGLPGALNHHLHHVQQQREISVSGWNDQTHHLLCREPIDSLLIWSSVLWPSPKNSVK